MQFLLRIMKHTNKMLQRIFVFSLLTLLSYVSQCTKKVGSIFKKKELAWIRSGKWMYCFIILVMYCDPIGVTVMEVLSREFCGFLAFLYHGPQ